MNLLRFKYANWNGIDHEYVIKPEDLEYTNWWHNLDDKTWCISGEIVTRDGDPRPDMDPARRRTFVIAKMRSIEEVPS